jgi:diguanylate cyclase (GGDEF)-like protein
MQAKAGPIPAGGFAWCSGGGQVHRFTIGNIQEETIGGRTIGALYLIGAGLAALSLLLPHPSAGEAVIWGIVGFAAIGGVALSASERVHPLVLHGALAAASLLISVATVASGSAAGLYTLMFFWVAIFSAYFFPPRTVALHVAWLLACYAVALTQVEHTTDYSGVTRWIVTAIAVGVAAAMTSWLAATRAALAEQARADALTGVPNRRWLRVELEREIARADRHALPLCAAMVDLDGFKEFNDSRGHPAGDALLVDATGAWRDRLRPSDFLARMGGDEFAVVLPDIELQDAELVMDRLRAATPEPETSSVGVVKRRPGEDPDQLLARADRLLYAAKAAGGNRVVSALPDARMTRAPRLASPPGRAAAP